jgi:DNA repair and recombination protein RAD54B
VQNDLQVKLIVLQIFDAYNLFQELYCMADFACPNVLGALSQFKRVYEQPIVAGQQPCATEGLYFTFWYLIVLHVLDERSIGEERLQTLITTTDTFMLRRTNELNTAYLPRKGLRWLNFT